MSAPQPVRGTQDLLPPEMRRHRAVSDTARAVSLRYGFEEMATPIFEFTEVFARPIGETSDIVSKEMYSFADRGGDHVTLRPENTAGVVRAVISHGLAQHAPLKYFYSGPMFRYERPQKGRFRQFHQIGIELLGVEGPLGDIEVIACGAAVLDSLGVLGRTRLELNTLGDAESREAYRVALLSHYGARRGELSEDSLRRLERNPLRILDSKDEGDRRVNETAPPYGAFLNEASRTFFAAVRAGLETLGIAFEVSPRLVRGLDYYSHTAFEFVTGDLGAQGTVMGGGRYDGLSASLGGPALPGVGWAAGIERLALLIAEPAGPPRPIAVVPVGAAAEATALSIAGRLRAAGHAVDLGYGGSVQKRMKRANKLGARIAVLVGEDELARGAVSLRDLDAGTQQDVPLAELAERLAQRG